ncbi:MAG TPA: hypothetical protein DCR46_06250 [Cytophagales bacterium]|nr:hypothetical protein [Cytophagales bacterium]
MFLLSGILSYLLYQQKSKRIASQTNKKEMGWNAIAVKKMWVINNKDTTVFLKKDGIWKRNAQFDGMGEAIQILNYLSTMQLENVNALNFNSEYELHTFDKAGKLVNKIEIGQESKVGICYARINNGQIVSLSNLQNKSSLRKMLKISI